MTIGERCFVNSTSDGNEDGNYTKVVRVQSILWFHSKKGDSIRCPWALRPETCAPQGRSRGNGAPHKYMNLVVDLCLGAKIQTLPMT